MENNYHLDTNILNWNIKTSQTLENPIKDMIQKSIESSCTVLIQSGREEWTGSGFHLGNGIIVTASHVAPPSEQKMNIFVSFDGQMILPSNILISDGKIDVALLFCPYAKHNISNVNLADSNQVEVGDIIATISSPEGWNDTATVGYVSNVHQSLGQFAPTPAWNDIIFIDADILQGSSGGMVINANGEVIGSVMGVTGQNAELGIGQRAICPANKIKELLNIYIGSSR